MTKEYKKTKNFKKENRLIFINLNTKKNNLFQSIVLGCGAGFINGFCGGGGGMVCVPALRYCLQKDSKVAHSTAIFVMLPLTIVSLIVYFFENDFEFKLTIPISIGFAIGGFLGAILLKKIKNIYIEILFCLIIFYCGIQMLLKVG